MYWKWLANAIGLTVGHIELSYRQLIWYDRFEEVLKSCVVRASSGEEIMKWYILFLQAHVNLLVIF